MFIKVYSEVLHSLSVAHHDNKRPKDTANTAKTTAASDTNRTREKRFNNTFPTTSEPVRRETDNRQLILPHTHAHTHAHIQYWDNTQLPSDNSFNMPLPQCSNQVHMHTYTQHAHIHTTCRHTHNMQAYTQHAGIHTTCRHTHNMQAYTQHASIHTTCRHTHNMQAYTQHASIHTTCKHTHNMQAYTHTRMHGYTYVHTQTVLHVLPVPCEKQRCFSKYTK